MAKKAEVIPIVIVLILAAFLVIYRPLTAPKEEKKPWIEVTYFDDHVTYKLNKNGTVTVEIWIENLGEATAYNVTCFVRARNQDGIVLFNDTIDMTSRILRVNETCTGYYMFNLMQNDTVVFHTIEITWKGGRNIHSERTFIT